MAFITASDFVKWDGTLFTNSDWDANVDAVATLTSAGTRDSAWSKVGIGTTTLNYPLNIANASSSRGMNLAMTTATTTAYGAYIDMAGASSSNIGLYISNSTNQGSSNRALSISQTGTGGGQGLYVNNTSTGTVNRAGQFLAMGAGSVNTGIYCTASGASSNTGQTITVAGQTSNTYGLDISTSIAGGYAAETIVGVKTTLQGASTNYHLYCTDYTAASGEEGYVKLPYDGSADNSSAPTKTVANGTMCFRHTSGVAKLYAYLSGAWKSVNLT